MNIHLVTEPARSINLEPRNTGESHKPPSHFDFLVIDGTSYLRESQALRYDIYCEEMHFLAAENYPDHMETDAFDSSAIHVGAVSTQTDARDTLVGTLRLVLPSSKGFPLFEHCKLFDEYKGLGASHDAALITAGEISRLALVKSCRRRSGDGLYDLASNADRLSHSRIDKRPVPHRRQRPEIVLGLYKTLYQESKRQGITHWFAAMEKTLLRLLHRYKFAFQPIGPEVDYYGPVTPYMVEIAEIEKGIYRKCPELFSEFIKGLAPELIPDYAKS